MGKIGKFLAALYADGFKVVGLVAPLLSAMAAFAKLRGMTVGGPQHISWAWVLAPVTAWLLLAYIRRWIAYEKMFPLSQGEMLIADAINYLVNDSVAKLRQAGPAEIAQHGPAKGNLMLQRGLEHGDARAKIQAKLVSGELKIWGERERIPEHPVKVFEDFHREVEKSYWEFGCLGYIECFNISNQMIQTVLKPGKSDFVYRNLVVSQTQIEKIWPKKSIMMRLLRTMRGYKRFDYWGRSLDGRYRLIDIPSSPEINVK